MSTTPDVLAWPLLEGLASEMLAEIEERELPPFCFTGILPGGAVALDYCSECKNACGMAWVRLASILEEPSANGQGFSSCVSQFNVNVEMGMIRCHRTMDGQGNPMSMQYQAEKAQAQMEEMAAMMHVLLCSDIASGIDKLLGQYNPIGPEGACVGGAWTASFAMF